MPDGLVDSSIVAYVDSLRLAAHRADSLGMVLQAYDATRDHWIAALQAQTAIFSLITAGLLAILVVINWSVLRGYVKRASKTESRKLESRLNSLALELDIKSKTAMACARKDVCVALGHEALDRHDWRDVIRWYFEAAISGAKVDMFSQAEVLLDSVLQNMKSWGDYEGLSRETYATLLSGLDSIRELKGAERTVELARKLLDRVRLQPVEQATPGSVGKTTEDSK